MTGIVTTYAFFGQIIFRMRTESEDNWHNRYKLGIKLSIT
jgi:hypothetical protein